MLAVYLFILCLSAGFSSYVAARIVTKFAPMVGAEVRQLGLCAVMAAIAFLIVVMAPPALLFMACALLAALTVAPRFFAQPVWRYAILALAIGGILCFAHPPTASYLLALPYPALAGASGLCWFAFVLAQGQRNVRADQCASITLFACLVLSLSPFFEAHASAVSTDAAIVASAWFGLLIATKPWQMAGVAPQLVNGLLLGYLVLCAVWQGAWPLAVAAALVYLAGMAYIRRQTVSEALEALTRA